MRQTIMAAFALLPFSMPVHAEGLHAVRPLPGYVCMQLALTPEENMDPIRGVPVRASPSFSDAVASWAPSVVVAPNPQQPTSGFLQVLLPNGHRGWIQAAALKPWTNPYSPNRRCTPSIMSNGAIGYDFK